MNIFDIKTFLPNSLFLINILSTLLLGPDDVKE